MRKNILITGLPHSGKSTILKLLITNYKNKVGMVTSEVVKNGTRTGFEIETNSGKNELFASIDIHTNIKVSKYFVDVKKLDSILPKISKYKDDDILYIDEIGQMELYSELFKKTCLGYMNSKNICLFTLSKVFSDKFIESVKSRNDVIIVEINEQNRNDKKDFLDQLIEKMMKAKRYLIESDRFKKNGDEIVLKSEHGIRTITMVNGNLICSCDFYKKYSVCSHILATEELIAKGKTS